jgi:hypothetical protein
MKFETLMLQSLFAACLMICLGTFGAMLLSPAPAVTLAANHAAVAATARTAG